ncbi:MAG: urease accessory protein UreD [Kyrpidia sp.]|nr:urease accessory protein UreD [Kyrpidia sp.]
MGRGVQGMWRAAAAVRRGRTVLVDTYQQTPLKVAKPFYAEDGTMVIYLMDASPGLLGGDRYEIACTLGSGARLFLTTPSSCRLHPGSGGEESVLIQRFRVERDAVLEYFPEPIVPFAGSRHRGETVLELAPGATALVGEVVTPGRLGMGEVFAFAELRLQTSVYWAGAWTAWDSLWIEPGRGRSALGWGEFTHMATLWVLSGTVGDEEMGRLRELASPGDGEFYGGVSRLMYGGCVLRVLGRSAWSLQTLLYRGREVLRPRLLGAPAWAPRKPGGV